MENRSNIINLLYGSLPKMSDTDHKIAEVVLADPASIVNMTISALARKASVSEASVSRFCKNLDLDGFHQLKIELAKVAEDRYSYYQKVNPDDLLQALKNISDNKVAEIVNTLTSASTATIRQVLNALKGASLIQVAASGGTFPVAADAVYKFNQLGLLAVTDELWETSIGQTMNLPTGAVLLVISNSGETRNLLTQIEVAKSRGILVIAITNRADSPIGLNADLHILTAIRQQIFESEYYFSRVAAMAAIEALFLLLLSGDKDNLQHIKTHEELIAQTKI
ncbi:MurR/RpiR family transcriptional regulator [Sporolactobacillus sp. CQH2019]|uniref:MurR/RpiR family transcriptional regulator n=1 Tax=Sporolactobacillus sp. CQH2019 TaxID=3023512 RepID=UPI002367B9C3|nr:MurR/RpiR family transcriptional regulator [Sporolactobacillus sp. CQH2019]MDD9150219.1 MurR/RpiR family transcriptional regulator [Sporolactobacillus sp. CQH2019]